MKQKRVFLDELDNTTKAYKVKVKVIEKGRPRKSPAKGTVYQSLIIEDDKGNRMRGALFGDQIDSYKEAFVYNRTYDIANAPIKRCDPQWKRDKDDLDYQMTFGNETVIQPLEQENNDIAADYKMVSQIPKSASDDEKYDVLGLVVFIEAQPRAFKKAENRETFVRDILIMDDCSQQPVTISAWNDLATIDCDKLVDLVTTPKVVAFTALKVSTYRGFSLSTTMSTVFLHSPAGNAAQKLQHWAYQNREALRSMHSRIVSVKESETPASTQQISVLLGKKLSATLQDGRHWLKVAIVEPDLKDMYAYVGCSKCGKRTDAALGEQQSCFSCSNIESIASPRITFNCNVSDQTGTLAITAFATHAELLLATEAKELFRIKQMNDKEAFEKIAAKLNENSHLIQVGPKATLARNNVLQWVLKAVQVNRPTSDKEKPAVYQSDQDSIVITAANSQMLDNEVTNQKQGPSDSKTQKVPDQVEPALVQQIPTSITSGSVALPPAKNTPDLVQTQKAKTTNRKASHNEQQTVHQQSMHTETQKPAELSKTPIPKLLQVKLEKGAHTETKANSASKSTS